MSIINKILSKKVKYPLSLRGTKQRSNLKGFSLIELMVAVVILAIVVLGIFLAFSNTWMGMANARDRTVATNYAREAMENVKNMEFELVTNENLGMAESVGTKFTRVITVNTESDNLKKIDTTVFWTNRQGQFVSVEPSMYINRTLLNPGQASRIMLYADPYYTVLPDAGTANIIAVIKDTDGNTKIDWTGGNIRFLIIEGSELGFLPAGADTPGVEPTNGRADTIFTGSGSVEGDVVIEASVDLPDGGGTVSNTITIRVTLDVVRIELSAAPDKMEADGITISTVTAVLVNSGGNPVEGASNGITFNISGEGIFVNPEGSSLESTTVFMEPEDNGTATIHVKSIADTPGVATVTASSEGLLSGTVNIITTGVATSIYVSVNPDLIYTDDDEGAVVTVEIQDINGNPVKYSGNIDLAASDGTEGFDQNPLIFVDTSSESTNFSSASAGIVTIIASEEDIGGVLTDGNADIEVRDALTADTIIITAVPKNILAGGFNNSVITATIKQGSIVISNYSNPITFEIVSDTSSLHDALLSFNSGTYATNIPLTIDGIDYGNDGVAVVQLLPASDVGICTIEVSTDNLVDPDPIVNTIEVGFYSSEDSIDLIAVPPEMLVDGDNCTVTATVVDEFGTPVTTYSGDITFTILVGWPKIAKFVLTGTSSLTTTLDEGQISVDLIPQSTAGTVTLKASSFTGMTDITGYLNIQVADTLINLVEDSPVYNSTEPVNIVTFDIEVQGAEVVLGEMQVSWFDNIASELLNQIDIEGTVVYSNVPGAVSGTIVDTVTTLPTGISTVNLYFNIGEDMSGKTYNIIFNPSTEYYPVEFDVP